MRLIDADELIKHEIEADKMGVMLVVGKGYILDAPTIPAPEQHTFYISTEQAFRVIISEIKGAITENAFSKKAEHYKGIVSELEKMLKEHMETGKINIQD